MIEYIKKPFGIIKVKLDGKLTGEIRPTVGGFRYWPTPKTCGHLFKTLKECKESLEDTN